MSLSAGLDSDVDDTVTFEFIVQNTATQEIELTFPTSQRGDVIVHEAKSPERVWQWSDGRMFTQAIEHVALAPGQELTLEFEWEDPLAGEYTAVAELTAEVGATATTSFTVSGE